MNFCFKLSAIGDRLLAENLRFSKIDWPFKKLNVWKRSLKLTKEIYRLSQEFPEEEKFELTSQIRRASTSIGLNIAEGKGRNTDKEFVRILYNARGSVYELAACLKISEELGFIEEGKTEQTHEQAYEVYRMLSGLINSFEEQAES